MSKLQTHDLYDVCAIQPGKDESPGNIVRHVKYPDTHGMVVAYDPRPQGHDNQPQVTVLWTKEPPEIEIQSIPIKAQSRKLNVKWSAEQADDLNCFSKVDRAKQNAELSDALAHHELTMEEAMKEDRDIKGIRIHQSINDDRQRFEIERWSDEQDRGLDLDSLIYTGQRIVGRGRY